MAVGAGAEIEGLQGTMVRGCFGVKDVKLLEMQSDLLWGSRREVAGGARVPKSLSQKGLRVGTVGRSLVLVLL